MLKLTWLGQPGILLDEQPVKSEMRKVMAILAYISLHPGKVSREALAALFWPENDQQHALGSLRRALWSLAGSLPGIQFSIDRETVGLSELNQVRIDVYEFLGILNQVRQHHPPETSPKGNPVCPACLGKLEKAVQIYRGDFLEGFNLKDCPEFDDWQFFQRESLRAQLAQALEMLATGYETSQAWEKALQHARHWVLLDRLNEAAERTLIRLYLQAGQRSAAARQYEILTQLLQDELGQAPDPETLILYQSLARVEAADKTENEPAPQVSVPPEPEPLIKTKLFIPSVRADRVARPRLLALLDAGAQRALTLISAPAGFGKTTLLAGWVAHTQLPVAWFSIDEGDNDPVRFVSYLVAALESALPELEGKLQGNFSTLQPSIQPALTDLDNQLAGITESFVLILDDFQFIHSQRIHQAVEFLLEKIPACMHFVIATRTDPPLSLARRRARDQLVEVRAADLRFTLEEVAGFLKQALHTELSVEDISALEARTEGWAAGLQLAALAIRGIGELQPDLTARNLSKQQDIHQFIRAFSGSHRFILDYLGQEVLAKRSEEIRYFLICTSILERLSAPLCDAVITGPRSQAILEALERENLFIVPLDHERRWYRYHHLFGELLRYQLGEGQNACEEYQGQKLPSPEILHQRAAAWFEEQNLAGEAIQHALAAKNFDHATALIEKYAQTMLFVSGETYTLSRWLAALPPEIIQTKPKLNILKAWAFITQSQFEAAFDSVNTAYQAVQGQECQDALSLLGEIALIRGVLAELGGRDVGVMRAQALLAWQNLPAHEAMLRGLAAWLLGASHFWEGDDHKAEEYLLQAIRLCRAAGNIYFTLVSIVDLGNVLREQGRFREAYRLLLLTQQQMAAIGQQHPMLGYLNISCSQILLQWNEVEQAEQLLQQGIELVAKDIPGEIYYFGIGALPYIRLAQGKREEAVELANDCLERLGDYSLPYVPAVVKSSLVGLWIRVNDRDRILEWLEGCGLTPDDPIPHIHIGEYISLVKVLIWQGRIEEALKVLNQLFAYSESRGQKGKKFYLLALKALIYKQLRNTDQALEALESSLRLAKSEGYIRSYVDEGQPMEELLWLGAARRIWDKAGVSAYATRLMGAFQKEPDHLSLDMSASLNPKQVNGAGSACFVEALSERELEVLRLAAAGMSNPEIGRALNLATGTVKTHIHHIIGKLGVQGRIQAITVAREQGLIDS